jgi:tetratricopeptide (TPR) repeat protein
MAPKSVARQRKLGTLALKNGDSATAERAFRAAIRWGKNSCFAGSKEYLELADIYHQKGQQTKQLQLLADGASRFGDRPVEQVQLLCRQAAVKHGINNQNDIEPSLIKIKTLAENHSTEMPAGMLLEIAEECYRLAKPDYARALLKTLLGNHHDDAKRVEEVRQSMQKYEEPGKIEKLIEGATRHLFAIQSQCKELIGAGEIVQAINRLNDTVERHPGNRTLALVGVKTMIDYMTQHGVDQGYYFRCRRSLDYLLQINADDQDANNALERLSGISSA